MDQPAPPIGPEPARPVAPVSRPRDEEPARSPRVYSVRSFLLELGTITAGVLIALSVDSLREWQQHRSLVRQARETIAREIAANKREVDGALADAPARDARVAAALALVERLMKGDAPTAMEMNLGLGLSELSQAGWQSAERTGALSHMDYAEVQKYSRLYALQELYELQQRRALERLAVAIALFSHGDPTTAPRADLETFRRELLALRGELGFLDQFGAQLTKGYQGALVR